MTFLLTGILAVLVVITLITLVNMIAGPFLKARAPSPLTPEIAVLVPARNEEGNIATLLQLLAAQDYPAFSVTVLDDRSSDRTPEIVRAAASSDLRIRLLEGQELPEGWTGKNWACHQLSRAAEGEIMLFVDADVHPEPHALRDTAAAFARYHADAVSAFPRQLLHGTAAALVIPVMDLILYAFLPLQLVHRSRFASLAAANGQWIAFNRATYDAIGGHAAVRAEIVEDVALSRSVKRSGKRMLLTSGSGSVSCRMYEGFAQIREGFSKNFFAAFGFRAPAFAAVLALMAALFVLPYLLLFTSWWQPALAAVGLNLVLRSLLALRSDHGLLSVLLHPIGVLAAIAIGIEAMLHRYRRGAVRWKDRRIEIGRGT